MGSEVGARRRKEGVEAVEGVGQLQPLLLDHVQPRVLVVARSAMSKITKSLGQRSRLRTLPRTGRGVGHSGWRCVLGAAPRSSAF